MNAVTHLHAPAAPKTRTFSAALEEHIAAISTHDVERFVATLAREAEPRAIGPSDTMIEGAEALRKTHAEWFATADWTFSPREVWRHEGTDMGIALFDVAYAEPDGEHRFLLSFVFVREAGGWRFLYDQNTPIH